MIQSRRKRVYSIDAGLYLCDGGYDDFLNELKYILDEEVADYESMPEGPKQSDRGTESKNSQDHLQRVIKALSKVVDGKRKTQELVDEVHDNLRLV